jgi:hypothetical protein
MGDNLLMNRLKIFEQVQGCKIAKEMSHSSLKTGISIGVKAKLLYLSDARGPLMMCPFTNGL